MTVTQGSDNLFFTYLSACESAPADRNSATYCCKVFSFCWYISTMISFFCWRILNWFSTWLFSLLRVAIACSSSWCCSVWKKKQQKTRYRVKRRAGHTSQSKASLLRNFPGNQPTFQWLPSLFFVQQLGHDAIALFFHHRQSGLHLLKQIYTLKSPY